MTSQRFAKTRWVWKSKENNTTVAQHWPNNLETVQNKRKHYKNEHVLDTHSKWSFIVWAFCLFVLNKMTRNRDKQNISCCPDLACCARWPGPGMPGCLILLKFFTGRASASLFICLKEPKPNASWSLIAPSPIPCFSHVAENSKTVFLTIWINLISTVRPQATHALQI